MECGSTDLDKNKNGGVRDWLNMYSVHGGEVDPLKRKGDTHSFVFTTNQRM